MSNYLQTIKKMLDSNTTSDNETNHNWTISEEDKNKQLHYSNHITDIEESEKQYILPFEQPQTKEYIYCATHLGAQGIYGHDGYKTYKPFCELFRPNTEDSENIQQRIQKNTNGYYHYRWNYRYTDVIDTKLGNRCSISIDFDRQRNNEVYDSLVPDLQNKDRKMTSYDDFTDKITLDMEYVDILQSPVLIIEGECLKEIAEFYPNIEREIIRECEFEVGGQRIDKIYDHYNYFFNQVLGNDMYERLNTKVNETGKLYIPLSFDVAHGNRYLLFSPMRYHEIKFRFETQLPKELRGLENRDIKCQLKFDAIYLAPEPKKNLIKQSHEQVIKQCQFTGQEIVNTEVDGNKIKLYFNHMVNGCLIYFKDENGFINSDILEKCTLVLDGHKRCEYLGDVLKCEGFHHLGLKDNQKLDGYYWLPISRINDRLDNENDYESHSTINFSRVDCGVLEVIIKPEAKKMIGDKELYINLHCQNSNVMRLMSGMAGLSMSK